MPATLKTGTVLIKEGTLFPDGLSFESEPCRWLEVSEESRWPRLGRRIHEAGWTFFDMDGEINVTVFGFDERKTVRRAVEQILASPKSEKFNSLEITRVASVASTRFLGVTYLSVCAHSRHIKESPILVPITEGRVRPLRAAKVV